MPIWIFALMYCQGYDVDEIQIGYVANDDAISYVDDIKTMYHSYKPIFDEVKPLEFPLLKQHKHVFVYELPKNYRDLIFSCENAEIIGSKEAEFIQYKPCGDCVPCRNIIAGNYYGTGEFPENYKEAVISYHARGLRKMGYKVVDEKDCELGTWSGRFTKEVKPQPIQLEFMFEGVIANPQDVIHMEELKIEVPLAKVLPIDNGCCIFSD